MSSPLAIELSFGKPHAIFERAGRASVLDHLVANIKRLAIFPTPGRHLMRDR